MARKKLLSEGEIRQFMKLANLRPIAQARLNEYSDMAANRDEELAATGMELGDEDRVAGEEADELDVADDELAAMDDAPVDPEKQEMLSNVVMAVADALGIGDQVDVDVEGDAGAPQELEVADVDVMDMGPEGGEMEVSAEDEMVAEIVRRVAEAIDLTKSPDNPLAAGTPARRQKYGGNQDDIPDADRKKKGHYGPGGKTIETAEEEGEVDFKEGLTDEKIVAEVAKRVARRLQRENKKEQMADQLAERIMKRLTK
tara:strand:- start:7638 stop:8408 length:771 start_codon:yes stop_codon:yes gene_type:complete